jgi:hypothetical protein
MLGEFLLVAAAMFVACSMVGALIALLERGR